MEEIKQIEYQLQSRSKQAASLPEKVSNEEIETIYKELSAPTPPRPKITSNYLEQLQLKFLDTRKEQLGENMKRQLPSSEKFKILKV
ncbi:hypothetical protein RMCBS344292_01086 [Rhizopus microsporus]|nr:hypothetical protein RMCBS344292_01086 [Rhizopus microsporus]